MFAGDLGEVRERRERIPAAETNLWRAKKRSVIIVTISPFSTARPETDIPHSGHVCAAEFIREPNHAIGRPTSIIYLGNYSEAGSTPVARGPQIIERQAFAVSPTTPAEPLGIVKRFLRNLLALRATPLARFTVDQSGH